MPQKKRHTRVGSLSAVPRAARKRMVDQPFELRCKFCPAQSFRRSRLRFQDLSGIMLMRYPVRCLRCRQRQAVSFTVAGLAQPSQRMQKRQSQIDQSWKQWTEHNSPKGSALGMGEQAGPAAIHPIDSTLPRGLPVEESFENPTPAPKDEDTIW